MKLSNTPWGVNAKIHEDFFHNHETLLTFSVGSHIYCMVDIVSKPLQVTVKVNRNDIEELKEKYRAIGKTIQLQSGALGQRYVWRGYVRQNDFRFD